MEKRKNIAIFFCLNSTSASSPKAESHVFFSLRSGGQGGKVKAYNPSATAEMAATYSCAVLSLNPVRSTTHMAQMKPTVPHTRMGGKSLTKSSLYFSKALYDTVLASESVGM